MSGTVIFNTTDSDSYPTTGDTGALNLGGATLGNSFSTLGQSATITDLKFQMSENNMTDNSTVVVSLHTNADTVDPTGTATLVGNLGTFNASDVITALGTNTEVLFDFVPTAAPTLTANTRYWIELSDDDVSSGINWDWTSLSNSDPLQSEFTYNSDSVYPNSTGPQIMEVTTACFAAGTHILTAAGERAVETLQPGDMLAVRDGGFAPMRWLGYRRVDCRDHPRPHDVWPVRVAAGAFGRGRPSRELVLSPDHAVFVGDDMQGPAGVLVPIRYLLNGTTIRQTPIDAITYHHVELDRHDILLAEGLPTESYLDTGNRSAFSNGGASTMAHPDFARRVWSAKSCAPLIVSGPALARIRAGLRAEATAFGYTVTIEPDLHLIVDGRRLDGARLGETYIFECPVNARDIKLASRTWAPAETSEDSDDWRRLGVAVASVTADDAELAIRPGNGWYETEGDWRWTNGMGRLPCPSARHIEITVALVGRYWQRSEVTRLPVARAA